MNDSQEMYLVVIAQANEDGINPVPVNHLAERLKVQPVSANQMIKKLEETSLICYTPYKGVELSPTGRREAARLLRNRRMWEVFLVENLGYPPLQADAIACQLEHIVSDEMVEKLSSFLGTPKTSPLGKPIPSNPMAQPDKPVLDAPLSMSNADEEVIVTSIHTAETERRFLNHSGVKVGSSLQILAVQNNGTCLIRPEGFPILQLAPWISHAVFVRLSTTEA
jgi:DtxR family Mn-dependent transcriptional regulator